MQKIVINTCYGGFGLSDKAEKLYLKIAGKPFDRWENYRDDPALVKVVEQLGNLASSSHADLKVVEVPNDVKWTIEEYDGAEWVAEVHRTWS